MNRKFAAVTVFMLFFAAFALHVIGLFLTAPPLKIALADSKINVKTVFLTFDDGPSDKVTPKILDVLDDENVKATFFIVGKNAERRKYLVEREYRSGHTVAVHSYTHEYGKIYRSPEALLEDIESCNRLISSITGKRSEIYRFPGGSYGLPSSLINAVCDHGYRYVDWNASVRDAEIWNATPQQLYEAAVATSSCCDNVVLLMHDSTTKSATAQALKDIIRYYKSNGYIFEVF